MKPPSKPTQTHPNPRALLAVGLLAALIVSGCATSPVSKELRKAAKASPGTTITAVTSDPAPYIGRTVIWGGSILKTVNETNASRLYVLQRPLTSNDEPLNEEMSRGRFIATSAQFLDPKEFAEGKMVTVAGQLVESQTEPLDQTTYNYPVVAAQEIYLWRPPTVQPSWSYYYYPTFYGYSYWPGYCGPYYGWGYHYPYHHYPRSTVYRKE